MTGLLWLVLCSSPAMAEPTEDELKRAEELFFNGQLLFDEQHYEEAILAWQQGYALSTKPGFLKNIAIAQEAQGHYQEAIDSIFKYRAFAHFEEQDYLKQWTAELQQKETIAKQLREEEISEKELSKQEKSVLLQPDSSTSSLPDLLPPQKANSLPVIFSWGTTAALATTAAILNTQAYAMEIELQSGCRVISTDSSQYYCMDHADNSIDIDGYSPLRLGTNASWALTIVSTGFSIWLTSRYYALKVNPTSLSVQGEFY